MAELLELTSSFDSQLDFEKAKIDRPTTTYNRSFPKHKTFCDYCRKPGHLEVDCFKKQNTYKYELSRQHKSKLNTQDSSPQNSFTNKKQLYKDSGVKPRPTTVNWNQTTSTNSSIQGLVNGHKASIIIDTGAQVTVVPGKFVYDDDLTGETVSILGVNGDLMPYQTATIPITLKDKTVYETVAVAPEDQLNAKVLLSTPINKQITQHLLDSYLNKQENKKQVNVATRSTLTPKEPIKYYPEQEDSFNEDDRASDLSYDPTSETDLSDTDRADSDITSEEESMGQAYAPPVKYLQPSPLSSQPVQTLNQTSEPFTHNHSTEPYSSTSLTLNPSTEPYSSNPITLNPPTEPYSSTSPTLNTEQISSDTSTNDGTLRSNKQPVEIPSLTVITKQNNMKALKASTKSDPTLKVIRGLAHHHKNGYTWDDGLIYHMSVDPTLGEKKRLAVPKQRRQTLLEIAHDKSGHFSVTKTRAILNNKFTWPGMGTDAQT